MLKIKDNVDLKELEKFGFRFDNYDNYWVKEIWVDDCNLVVDADKMIYYVNYTTADMNSNGRTLLTTIFDLIQAGLVEKVVE